MEREVRIKIIDDKIEVSGANGLVDLQKIESGIQNILYGERRFLNLTLDGQQVTAQGNVFGDELIPVFSTVAAIIAQNLQNPEELRVIAENVVNDVLGEVGKVSGNLN